MPEVIRPAAPSSHTGVRSGIAGTIAANLGAIAVYYANMRTPADIQTEVNILITTAVGFGVAAAIGWLGSYMRDAQAVVEIKAGEEPKASTMRVPI